MKGKVDGASDEVPYDDSLEDASGFKDNMFHDYDNPEMVETMMEPEEEALPSIMSVEDVADIRNQLQGSRQEFEDCLATCVAPEQEPQVELMELCCESSSLLSAIWEKGGGKAGRLGLHNKCDLLTESGTQEAIRLIKKQKPTFLWVSLPCGATSPLQHLNEITPEGWMKSQKRRNKSKRLTRNGIRVMEAHLLQGGELIQEWPMLNDAWKFPTVIDFWNSSSQTMGAPLFPTRTFDFIGS